MKLLLKLILIGFATFTVLVGLRTLGQMIHPGATHYWVGKPAVVSGGLPYAPTNGLAFWFAAEDLSDGNVTGWTDRISSQVLTNGPNAPVKTSNYVQFTANQRLQNNLTWTENLGELFLWIIDTRAISAWNPIFSDDNGTYRNEVVLKTGASLSYEFGGALINGTFTTFSNICDVELEFTEHYGAVKLYTNGVLCTSALTMYNLAPDYFYLGYQDIIDKYLENCKIYDFALWTNNVTSVSAVHTWATNRYHHSP